MTKPERKYIPNISNGLLEAVICPISPIIKKSNRRLLVFIAILLGCVFASYCRPGDKPLNRPYSDMRLWHLGFSVGTHFQDLNFTHNGYKTTDGEEWYVEVPSFSPGVCINVLGDLRLHKYMNLRLSPGMYFGSKSVKMREYVTGETMRQEVKSTYVVVPLDLKVSGDRYKNSRPYVTLGAMAAFDIGKKRREYLQFNSADAYISVGLGCDFYLPFFKLNPEIKFCFGLTDILRHDRPDLVDDPMTMKITQSLSKVKSNMFILTFYFE